MGKFTVGIQCGSIGQRCGIYTYSQRLEKYLNKNDIDTIMFDERIPKGMGKADIINIQYEPGMCQPQKLNMLLNRFKKKPIVATTHHSGIIDNFYDRIDGLIFHDETQVRTNPIHGPPWDHIIIPHPALIYPKKDKNELRKKYGLPIDKKILGTAGFICGTGKELDFMLDNLLGKINSKEFIYFPTSNWKAGDMGLTKLINSIAKKYNREDNFKLDTEFVPPEVLNEKMQCCDFMFSWNNSVAPGSNSGVAMDMLGAHVRVIVKDVPHYHTPAMIPGVLTGRQSIPDFAFDTIKAFRKEDLTQVPKIDDYSWDKLIHKYIEYFEDWL
jgi:hypothetical protein